MSRNSLTAMFRKRLDRRKSFWAMWSHEIFMPMNELISKVACCPTAFLIPNSGNRS